MADLTTSDIFAVRFDETASERSIVLEDDGRVAYAYLLVRGSIAADVWLYNVASAPQVPEWPDESKMPFLNPSEFCRPHETSPRLSEAIAIQCKWTVDAVEVVLDGIVVARLVKGSRPGWSRLASKRGPLALPLVES